MSKRATRSIGTQIRIGTKIIGDLTSIGSPSVDTEEIDVTTLDSAGAYREFIPGFKDAGELNISGFFVPTDEGQAALYEALESGETQQFEILYPSKTGGASWSFPGFVKTYTVNTDLEEAIGIEATIRVSGQPYLNLAAGTGLTGLSLAGTGGTLSPAFSTNIQNYAFNGVTASSVTLTATGAGQTIRLYIDGVYSQDLTSGQASNAIPVATGSKMLTIVAQETGKASVTYEVIVIKP
jgi:Phage major tail protein 2.